MVHGDRTDFATKYLRTCSAGFTNGESDEFQKEDYQKAFSHYISALGKSRTPEDSAKVLNALGADFNQNKKP